VLAISSFLLGADNLSIETSAFFHENLLGSQSSSPSEDEFLIYHNSSAGFSIKYPSEWHIQKLEAKNWVLIRPIERGIGLGIELTPIKLPSTYAEGSGLEILLAEGKKLAIDRHSSNKTSGFKVIESNMTTIDGNRASKLVYLEKALEPEKESKFTEMVFVRGNWRYFVILSAYVEAYDHYEPTFQKMIDSIKITDPMY
jgi:hypothetical protein